MDLATVNCAVIKGEPTEIWWMFNKFNKLSSNDGISIIKSGQRISMLNIESVRARHRGNYTCIVKYAGGFVEHTAELKVNGSWRISFQFYEFRFVFLYLMFIKLLLAV